MNIKIFFGRVFSFRNAKTAALALGGIAVFLFAVSYGLSWYEQWKGRQGVENLAEMLKKIEAEDYKLAMADTYGGKTPQETLQMYIDAVEKGDYELASRYFRDSHHEEQERILESINKNNETSFLIDGLKSVAPVDKEKEYQKSYELNKNIISSSEEDWINNLKELDKDYYEMVGSSQGYEFFISFVKYPNNIWKFRDEIEIKNISENYFLKF